MNETLKALLISLSCLVADFSGIAIVAKCLVSRWSKMRDDLSKVKGELVQCNKKMNELIDSNQWLAQSNEDLKLELRGIKAHAKEVKKN